METVLELLVVLFILDIFWNVIANWIYSVGRIRVTCEGVLAELETLFCRLFPSEIWCG